MSPEFTTCWARGRTLGLSRRTVTLSWNPALSENPRSMASLASEAAASASALPACPLEIPFLGIEPCRLASATIQACLNSPSVNAIRLVRIPCTALADRPLDIRVALPGVCAASNDTVARVISANAYVTVVAGTVGLCSVPISVHPWTRSDGWVFRVLIRPASWADAASVTVDSISLTGRPLPCDGLPATLRVGYNHTAPAPAAAVLTAAKAGNVAALQFALDDGGSTEEADEVCVHVHGG